MFVGLSSEMLKKQVNLLRANLFGKRNERKFGLPRLLLYFDDFVLQYEMSTKGVPSQLDKTQ